MSDGHPDPPCRRVKPELAPRTFLDTVTVHPTIRIAPIPAHGPAMTLLIGLPPRHCAVDRLNSRQLRSVQRFTTASENLLEDAATTSDSALP